MITTVNQLMDLAHTDPKYIIESGFWVVNKSKDTVPFIFNENQNDLYHQLTTRDDILKGSQFGISTLILAILDIKFLLVPNSWSVCISHESEATRRLFAKIEYFNTHLPPWLSQFLELSEDSAHNLVNKKMNSRFYIGTAGARSFGRGDTIHYAHMSEISRWAEHSEVANGIIRAVPDDSHTWIVKETTANGQGNMHHTEWKREKEGLSKFKPIFLCWIKQKEYQVDGATITDYTPKELHYKRLLPEITDAQLMFRRRKISELLSENGKTPEEMFMQEFPLTEDEAFLASGNPFFPTESTQYYLENIKAPIFIGNLEGISPYENLDETQYGNLKIWEMPEVGGQYLISADVAKSGDFCDAGVIDKKTWKTIATWHGHINPGKFGKELVKLGNFYNKALLVIEENNQGIATIDSVVEVDYPNVYKRRTINQQTKKETEVYGWWTSSKTRPLMLGYFQDLVRVSEIELPEKELIDEMITFVRNDDGKPEASVGNHDDRVIRAAMGYYVLKEHPYLEKKPITGNYKSAAKRYKTLRGLRRYGR